MDRNIIVTGGSHGLGLGITEKLRKSGYHPIIWEAAEPPLFLATEMDLSFIKKIREDVGPIYGLVNNAGIGTSGLLANMQDSTIEALILHNALAPALLTKHVIRAMMTDGIKDGRIISISSVAAFTGFSGLSLYSMTNAALIGFTKSLARELGPLGITVNAICPGFEDAAMVEETGHDNREQVRRRSPLGRLAQINDIANAVEFLISDNARNITGTVITVDAGATA